MPQAAHAETVAEGHEAPAAASPGGVLAWLGAPLGIYLLCAGVYVAMLGSGWNRTSSDAHFVHLADSFLHGQLSVVGERPPGNNDWALYDGRWYVSFPPFPAVLLVPWVALFGTHIPDRLIWALFAGLGPALLYVLLRTLRQAGRSGRRRGEDLALVGLFAFGTVYFFSAVQGTVWFAAHVVAVPLLALYALASLDARRPLLAGLCLGLCFMTRPTTLLAGSFFVVEALAATRQHAAGMPDAPWQRQLLDWLRGVDYARAARTLAWFALPLLAIGLVAMVFNHARFDDPFEFGHRYLQIRWRPRIEKWGLFNYHYLARNLAVFGAALPWISSEAPFLRISRHGLALWFTTPQLLLTLWPKRMSPTLVGLYLAAGAVAVLNLLYQNSGWIQFGYRFSLDYLPLLFMLLALGGRRFGVGFYALLAFAIAVNAFGAATFDRMPQFYDTDRTQRVIFHPD